MCNGNVEMEGWGHPMYCYIFLFSCGHWGSLPWGDGSRWPPDWLPPPRKLHAYPLDDCNQLLSGCPKASGLLTSWWRWHKTMGHPWDTFTNIKPPASQQLAVEVCWTTVCSIWEPYNQCGSALGWYIILLVCLCSFHALWRQLVPATWPFVTPSKRFGWTPYIKTFFEIQKQMSFENSTLTCSRYTMISKVIERLPLHHLIYIDISLPVVST